MTTQGHHEATCPYQLGIDVGSTTVKAVVLDGNRRLFSDYRRHNADVRASLGTLLADVERALPGARVHAAITGSGGLTTARAIGNPLRPGSHRRDRGHPAPPPRSRRRHRTGRRGRQAHLPAPHPRAAYERHLRGWHRCLHRPDGDPPAHGRLRPRRAGDPPHPALPDRLALRRVRQVRHPAPHQPGCRPRGPGRLHLQRRRHPDHRRPGVRAPDPRNCHVPRRSPTLPARPA